SGRGHWPTRSSTTRTRMPRGSGFGVLRRALELHPDEGLVPEHPGVVARGDPVGVARSEIDRCPILVLDVDPAGDDVTKVLGLAAVGSDDRLDALGPAPARLEREPADLRLADLDDVDHCLLGLADLVGAVQVLRFDSGHLRLLR